MKWSQSYKQSLFTHDTSDSNDTKRTPPPLVSQVSQVSVIGGSQKGAGDATPVSGVTDVTGVSHTRGFVSPALDIERAAIQAEAAMPAPPAPPPLAVHDPLVQRLAAALMAPRPWQKITDPEKALAYFQGEALHRLRPLDPLARGLLVSAEENEANRWKAKL
jgi:hypothetical protein